MIEHADPNHLANFREAIGDGFIFSTGSRIARGVIMNEQDGGRRVANRWTKHFTRMNQAGIEGTHGDSMRIDGSMLRIERYDVEFLLATIDRKPLECAMQ